MPYDYQMQWYEKIYTRCYQAKQSMKIARMICQEPKVLKDYEACIDILLHANKKRVLLVTGPHVNLLGLTRELEQKLCAANISYTMYIKSETETYISDVEQARILYEKERCSAMIAIGGGSVMNCAKLCAAKLVKTKDTVRMLSGVMQIKTELPMLIAIPTTAGSGCEASMTAAAMSDKLKLKWLAHDVSLIPRYVLLDSQLTKTLSQELTAFTGISALAQAIEVYIGLFGSKKSRKYAELAVRGIFDNLQRVYLDGEDLQARKHLLIAAHHAGLAQLQTFPGYVHAMANAFSMQCKIPHAMAQAILLPVTLQAYGEKCYKQLGQLAKNTEVVKQDVSIDKAAPAFINRICTLQKQLGIPSHYPLSEIDIVYIASHTLHEANPVYPVPKLMGYEEIEKILRSLSEGTAT